MTNTLGGLVRCSIVIPVHNRVDLTEQCLAKLRQSTDLGSTEVIVVDDASTDGTAAFLAEQGTTLRVIRSNLNVGFAAACNQGARAATGQYLVFLNNDTIPLPGWLDAMIEAVERQPEIAIVGSKLLYADGTIQHAGAIICRLNRMPHPVYQKLSADDPLVNRPRQVRGVTAACMLIERSVFERLGGFDEGYRNGFEDIDLCLRARNLGLRIFYEPKSVLYHLESQTPTRHLHDEHNGRHFRERWWHPRWVDEDWFYFEDGIRSRAFWYGRHRCGVQDRIQNPEEEGRWRLVAETQRRLHEADGRTLHDLVECPELWPRDISVLDWAADVCEAYALLDQSRLFRLHAERLGRSASSPSERLFPMTIAQDHDNAAGLEQRAKQIAQSHTTLLAQSVTPWMRVP